MAKPDQAAESSVTAAEATPWQFKLVIGVILIGVLGLIGRVAGLF